MIELPPGCTINYHIRIFVKEFTEEMTDWYTQIGGVVTVPEEYNYKGRQLYRPVVRYGNGRYSYWMQGGAGSRKVLLHFNSEDANIALMFVMKFSDFIESHNFEEIKTHVY